MCSENIDRLNAAKSSKYEAHYIQSTSL